MQPRLSYLVLLSLAAPLSTAAAQTATPPPTPAPASAGGTPSVAPPEQAAVPPPPPAAPDDAPPAPPPPPTFPEGPPPPPTFPDAPSGSEPAERAPLVTDSESPPSSGPSKPEPLGMFGIELAIGLAVGGDEIVNASFDDGTDASLAGGNGISFGLGFTLTPLRTESHALGLGVDQSVKLAQISASNAEVSLTRFPLVVSLRYAYSFNPAWSFVAGPGLVYEYGISLSSSGDASGIGADFEPALGYMFEGGVGYREHSLVIDATLRFTGLQYQVKGPVPDKVDATHGALVIKFGYVF